MRRAVPYVILVLVVAAIIYALQPPRPIGEGDKAPNVVLQMLDGETKSLQSFQDKVVVLDFWATWCAPCQFTMPKLIDFYKRHRNLGVEVIGVAVDLNSTTEVEEFVKQMGVPYPIAVDGSTEVKTAYEIKNLPTLFVIDKQGTILMRMEGYDPQNTDRILEETVKRALGK